MNGVFGRELVIDAVEQILLVALVVCNLEFRGIEKAAIIQSAHGDEIPPLGSAETQIESNIGRPKTAVRGGDTALGSGHALAGAGCHVDHDAGLVAVFGRRRAGDDFQGLHGIERNLVRELLALLIGDGLAVHRE